MNEKTAKVYLIGAGPGDPELLTLKALRALQACDVVLHDALVDGRVLDYARPGTRCVDVGKRGGATSTSQAFIQRLMVREARAGRVVGRVKGGDPYVFGRGGEEYRYLLAHGIDVEVVPGVTAGIAAPARAGIAVTDRGASHGVILVTGHAAPHACSPDWELLAKAGLTLVIYMGISRCGEICQALMRGGLAAATPAAVVQSAWQQGERSHVSTLGMLAAEVRRLGFGSPAILVIGEVARHAEAARGAATEAGQSR